MHRSEGANWKKSGTRKNADGFVRYSPASAASARLLLLLDLLLLCH